MIFNILTSFIITVLIFYFSFWVYTFFKTAPYYPSNRRAIRQIIEIVKEHDLKKIAELGAGDGRLALAIAKEGVKVDAIELNPVLACISYIKKLLSFTKNIHIYNNDFFNFNYSDYDGIVVYLFPKVLDRLEAKLFSELPDSAIIISNTFKFKHHSPIFENDKLLIYKVVK